MGEGNIPPGQQSVASSSRNSRGARFDLARVALATGFFLGMIAVARPVLFPASIGDGTTARNLRTIAVASLQYAADHDLQFPRASSHALKALAHRGLARPAIAAYGRDWPTLQGPLAAYGVRPEHFYSPDDGPHRTLWGTSTFYNLTGSSFEYEFSASALHLTIACFARPETTALLVGPSSVEFGRPQIFAAAMDASVHRMRPQEISAWDAPRNYW